MIDRRTFLLAGGTLVSAQTLPSARIAVGVIGSGGRGRLLIQTFKKDPSVTITSVCDVYEPNLQVGLSSAGGAAKGYRNYKQLLDDKDIGAVIVATPEHWHHQMVLDALAAGKDVYVEKPLCHTPEEGVELVNAEKKSKNIVQVGMQRRSFDLFQEGAKIVVAGTLGSVRMVRSWWLNNYLGQSGELKLAGALDWEQWQGPVKKRVPLDLSRFQNWRLYSDYASGIVGDQGAHIYDGIHMLMSAGYPLAVTAAAGKPHKAGVDMPESAVVVAEYQEDFIATFSINYAAMRYLTRNDQLNQLDGDQARMDVGREELRVFPRGAEQAPSVSKASAKGFAAATDAHVQNFLDCVRTRQTPSAPMALGFPSILVIQLANLSIRHGRRVKWNDTLKKVEL
jgi:predicted dehydrogenase